MLNINVDLFRRFSDENKLKMIEKATAEEILKIQYSTIERMVKEAGRRLSPKHIYKSLFLNSIETSNGRNSNISSIYQSYSGKHELYLDVYIQGEDTDTTESCKLRDLLNGTEILGSFMESYSNGYEQRICARYDRNDRVDVLREICRSYVTSKKKLRDVKKTNA